MFLVYARKELSRRLSRTALAVVGTAVSVAMLVAVFAIAGAVKAAVQHSLNAAGADLVIQHRVKACPFSEVKLPLHLGAIPQSLVPQLEKQPGVEEVAGVLEIWAFHNGKPTVVTGVDPERRYIGPVRRGKGHQTDESSSKKEKEDETCCSLEKGASRYLISGEANTCLIERKYADTIGAKLGDQVRLGPRQFKIVGILKLGRAPQIAGAQAFIALDVAQQMLGQGPIVDTIFVRVKGGQYQQGVTDQARGVIGPETSVTTSAHVDAGMAVLASATQGAMVAVSSIVVALVFLMLIRSALAAVQERIPEIGIMKAVGWRNADVSRLLTLEAALTAAVGGLVGCVLGWCIAFAYTALLPLKLPDALASYPPCADTPPPVALPVAMMPTLSTFVLGFGAALLMGVISGFLASRRAARLRPAEALRHL
jgi:putative ABC transport system permease protein